jgi:subfamily B ATP-binding cassette protein MsbA
MMYVRLLRYLRPHVWWMAATVVASFIAAGLDALSLALLAPFLATLSGTPLGRDGAPAAGIPPAPVIPGQAPGMFEDARNSFGDMMSRFIGADSPLESLNRLVLIILATVFAKNVFVWISGQFGARLQEFVTRDLRNAVYAHLERLPLGFFMRNPTGQMMARVLSDTQMTKQLITQLVTQTLQNVALVAVYLTTMVLISTRLTLVALIAAPMVIGLLQPLLKKLRSRYRSLGNQYGDMTSVVQETVSGVRLVKSAGAEEYEEQRFREASDRYSGGMVRVSRLALLAQPVTEVAGTIAAMLVLWYGGRAVLVDRSLTGAELVTFLVFVMRLLQPLKQISQIPTTAQSSLAAADRLFEVIDLPTEAQSDRGTRTNPQLREAIVFDDVTFAYEDEAVLSDISFTAKRGEVVALVGPSGAGKSTLVDLIPRFYEPTSGRILLDGVDTREYRLDTLRALTGIVSQDTVLFNDTVKRNIAYGAGDRYSQPQIEAAARAANAHQFISELPEGYDTILGERGTRLSGGQRQRIAIARALLTDPPILILDEATSALDTQSERLVQEAIDRLLEGRTVFVIAHRLSTVTSASQILVLDRGRIVERGTHPTLVARGGMYSRLHALQFQDRPTPATV